MTEGVDVACRRFVEIVTDYLEGDLPAEHVAAIDAHLAVCPGCRVYLDQMRATIAATGGLSVESIDPRTRAAIVDSFRDLLGPNGPAG